MLSLYVDVCVLHSALELLCENVVSFGDFHFHLIGNRLRSVLFRTI